MLYRLIRPLLFALDAERAHTLTLKLLHIGWRLPGLPALVRARCAQRVPALPQRVMGLNFPHPVGLAAGLDKQAEAAQALLDLGFAAVELGTVTPRPQPGNPRPRMFRLPGHQAIINRMGFNSPGLARFLTNLSRHRPRGIVGINIGKNKDTPPEQALDDYIEALRAVYPHADYVAVNISSPNTPGLRLLQDERPLAALLAGLKAEQRLLADRHGRYVPLALKIAPDLDDSDIAGIARLLMAHQVDAVIATNTTVGRPGLADEPVAAEAGGLSGRPLRPAATRVIGELYRHLQGRVPIVGVGGISNAEDAWETLLAGADLVQIYSAFIYQGPAAIGAIVAGVATRMAELGVTTAAEARTKLA